MGVNAQSAWERVIEDAAAALRGLTVSMGHSLGFYEELSLSRGLTSYQLAERTGTDQGQVAEWLHSQVAAGYLEYDQEADSYTLQDAFAAVFADDESSTYTATLFTALEAVYATGDQLLDAFRTGRGVDWAAHDERLDSGLAGFFFPTYRAHLASHWLPAVDGLVENLKRSGATVADIGCGVGRATLLMADAFPDAHLVGFDYSAEAIGRARQEAGARGLSDRVRFEVAAADAFPGGGYELITTFNCLHDLGDPVAAARRVYDALHPDGTWMLVEPNASPDPNGNAHPVGRLYTALSSVMCLPAATAQNGPTALGNHAGEDKLKSIAAKAGFSRWRCVAKSPLSLVYEVKR